MADWPIKMDLTPLVCTVSKGMEKLGDLVFGGALCRNACKKALIETQNEKEKQAILSGQCHFHEGKLVSALPVPNTPPLHLALAVEQGQELNNLAECLQIAREALQETPDDQISDEPVDPDWFFRWRREAKCVGNEEVQRLWGIILAEEVKKPSSFSLRTLDVLRNLSRSDVELYCRMRRYFVHTIFPCYSPMYPSGFTHNDVNRMCDAGIFKSLTPRGSQGEQQDDYILLDAHDLRFCCTVKRSLAKNQCAIAGMSVSQAGIELQKIGSIPLMSSDVFNEIACVMHIHSNAGGKFLQKMVAYPKIGRRLASLDEVIFEYTFS